MKIVILMKQVPDTDEVKMDPETGTMIRDGVGGIVNPLDLNALEGRRKPRRPCAKSSRSARIGQFC